MQRPETKEKSLYRQIGDSLGNYYPGGVCDRANDRIILKSENLTEAQIKMLETRFGERVAFNP